MWQLFWSYGLTYAYQQPFFIVLVVLHKLPLFVAPYAIMPFFDGGAEVYHRGLRPGRQDGNRGLQVLEGGMKGEVHGQIP